MFSKVDFINANKEKTLNTLDYLHALYKFENIHDDLFDGLIELMNPELEIKDNMLFIKSIFNAEKYANFVDEGLHNKDIQYWMNLIEITSIFEGINVKTAENLGKIIISILNNKITHQFSEISVKAILINEEDKNEIYITIQSTHLS